VSKEGKFLIFCIERYRAAKSMSGRQVIELFKTYRVADYIMAYYEALHTTGERYIVHDIDLYIQSRMPSS
jgi:hypothetical protein